MRNPRFMAMVLAFACAFFGTVSAAQAQTCSIVKVERDRLPMTLSLYQLSGDRVVAARSIRAQTLNATVELEDCQDTTFYGFTASGEFFLVRRSDVRLASPCQCLARASKKAATPAAGELPQCKPPC